MFKNKFKIATALILLAILLFSTFSFATETDISAEEPTSNNETVTTSNDENVTLSDEAYSNDDIYQGDLYLFPDSNSGDVVMDKLVNGNVYIIGKNVKISGQVAGNVFVMGTNITFEKESYVQSSVFALGQNIEFSSVAYDLYAACQSITIAEDCGVYRDARIAAESLTINGIIGRDAYISGSDISINSDTATIYGNLTYNSQSELTLDEGVVEGTVTYNPVQKSTSTEKTFNVASTVKDIISTAVFCIVIWFVLSLIAPKFEKNTSSISNAKTCLKYFGIGLLQLIAVPVISIILMFIPVVGAPIGLFLLAIYFILMFVVRSLTVTGIGNILSKKFNSSNSKLINCLFVAISSIVISIISLIPYLGGLVGFIVFTVGYGMITAYLFFNKAKKVE